MPPKKKESSGLGKALINKRFNSAGNGVKIKVNSDGSMMKHTTETEYGRASRTMVSVTQENDLEAFLSYATLAGTEFTAEKLNIEFIPKTYKNPFLLDEKEEEETIQKHKENWESLTVPRRPVWDGEASPEEQQRREREAFLEWRRSLVVLEEDKNLLMTPYERNIEVWRQLWRVIERSDIVIQIVDGRNPLMFRSEDLDVYVKEVDERKETLLLINKADMLTVSQRTAWADHFENLKKETGVEVKFVFFSAALAKKRQTEMEEEQERIRLEIQRREEHEKALEEIQKMEISIREDKKRVTTANFKALMQDDDNGELGATSTSASNDASLESSDKVDDSDDEYEDIDEEGDDYDEEDYSESDEVVEGELIDDDVDSADGIDFDGELEHNPSGMHMSNAWRRGGTGGEEELSRIRILSCDELLDYIHGLCPAPLRETEKKVTIGFVGYPNVGKSSTLNALVGAKLVTVSSTPGKTKHFQTIHLDDTTVLCDCPGLVFPSFAVTKAEMVVNGILPIDQLKEHSGPSTLVAMRIPRHALEFIYGIKIRTLDSEGRLDNTIVPNGEDLCKAYAVARGFKKAVQGNPDESRAARIILKDFVQGKLLFCTPPPGLDPTKFNELTYAGPEYRRPKKAPQTHEVAGLTRKTGVTVDANSEEDSTNMEAESDGQFFVRKDSGARIKGVFSSGDFTRSKMYPHQIGAVASAGSVVTKVVGSQSKGKARVISGPPGPLAPPAMGVGISDSKSKKHHKERRVKKRTNWTADY